MIPPVTGLQKMLETAASQQDMQLMLRVLSSGVTFRTQHRAGSRVLLHRMASEGEKDIVRLLLEWDYPVDLTHCEYGRTALWWAVNAAELATMQVLLSFGADSNFDDGRHSTPMCLALMGDVHVEMLRAMLACGCRLPETMSLATPLLTYLIEQRRPAEIIQEVIPRVEIEPKTDYMSPLAAAVSKGRFDIIPWLLSAGADPNGLTPAGKSIAQLLDIRRLYHHDLPRHLSEAAAQLLAAGMRVEL